MLRHLGAGCALALGLVMPAAAQDDALVTFQILAPRLAAELATATMSHCEEQGFQVAVSVVDRFGVPQAMVRNRFAGPHTPDTAQRKAWTAVSFRTDTLELAGNTAIDTPFFAARDITNALMLGGGVVIEAAGQMVGGIGVSGAPSGEADEACARAGLAAIQNKLPF